MCVFHAVLRFVGPSDNIYSCSFVQMLAQRLENAFDEAQDKVLETYNRLTVEVLQALWGLFSPAKQPQLSSEARRGCEICFAPTGGEKCPEWTNSHRFRHYCFKPSLEWFLATFQLSFPVPVPLSCFSGCPGANMTAGYWCRNLCDLQSVWQEKQIQAAFIIHPLKSSPSWRNVILRDSPHPRCYHDSVTLMLQGATRVWIMRTIVHSESPALVLPSWATQTPDSSGGVKPWIINAGVYLNLQDKLAQT